jgi:hypothetical protein
MTTLASSTNPSSRGETLAAIVESNKELITRFFPGFDDASAIRQMPTLPNHVLWQCGHIALTMHRIAERLDGKPLPSDAFVTGDGRAGSRERGVYDTESVSVGSTPIADAAIYPRFDRAVEIVHSSCDRLAAACRNASDAALDAPQQWGAASLPLWLLVARAVFHNGIHTGQVTDLRRAMSMDKIIKVPPPIK